jgi:uncharacterized membrane protein HdeD (DUF308 family)
MNLLIGANPRKADIVLALMLGLLLASLSLILQQSMTWPAIITALLALYIGAGLISNVTTSTNQAWREQSRQRQWIFVIFHLTVYPAVILLVSESHEVSLVLIGFLVIKTGFFYSRVILSPRENG